MIQAQGLTKYFDDFLAVDGVNLDVPAGKVLVLLGPNGAGKTTTVRMLTSILRPSRGSAVVAGYDVSRQPDQVRRSVGVLTEHHGLYGRMNSLEYLSFFGNLYSLPPREIRERSLSLLEQFGLAGAERKRLSEYSKGMRQKLALVRAMLHNPPVLLLDEPTSAMDPESARTVRNAIDSLRSAERTILLCTHNLVEAEELADAVSIIQHGRIIAADAPERLKELYLGPKVFELRLAGNLNGLAERLPQGFSLVARGDDWLRFQSADPHSANPRLVAWLTEQGAPGLVSLSEVPRSLESAYLAAVGQNGNGGAHV